MRTIKGINYFADDIDADVIDQMETAVFSVDGAIGSLMADAHLGYRMPIGGVIAYPDKISPSGVGYDIGCGNYAVRLHENVNFTKEMGDEINRIISFGIGGSSRIEHSRDQKAFIEEWDWDLPLLNGLKDIAMNQYATVGGGNHYVDLMEDTEGNSWIAVHFGSRGFGWQICKRALDILGMKDSMMGTPALINKGTALYDDYLYAHNCALDFAEFGRRQVVADILNHFRWHIDFQVENHHNFAEEYTLDSKEYIIHRKGATPHYGGYKFIGGSMGDVSVIVEGNFNAIAFGSNRDALHSLPHGAGRLMSRGQAKKSFTQYDMDAVLESQGVKLIGGGVDESPMAYRPLMDVINKHRYVTVTHTLMPRVVIMASGRDKYKD